jgi:hypothetical protein
VVSGSVQVIAIASWPSSPNAASKRASSPAVSKRRVGAAVVGERFLTVAFDGLVDRVAGVLASRG